jgi:hypothetical protein
MSNEKSERIYTCSSWSAFINQLIATLKAELDASDAGGLKEPKRLGWWKTCYPLTRGIPCYRIHAMETLTTQSSRHQL